MGNKMKEWFQGLSLDEGGEMDLLPRIILAVIVLMFLVGAVLIGTAHAQAPAKPDIIEVLEINGEINAWQAKTVAETVEKVNENPKIKGVFLVVNSPGGGASASAVIYQELAKIKVPVVGFCEYYCASGGAYALMSPSVKYIAVRDESIGGSIGVIAQVTRFNRLLDWAKIDNETFKSGLLKDSGNATRDMSDADRAYLQSIVDTLAEKFYAVVVKARPKVNLAEIKTARIFIGDQIVKVGLADAVMSRDDAVRKLKELSGSKNAYTREELRKITKDASEAAGMRPTVPPSRSDGWVDRGMAHLDTAMEMVGELRAGESVRLEYRMGYRF